MQICDLSNEDITRIVTDIFSPKRIVNITRHKRDDYISCNIYTEWTSKDENGKEATCMCKDGVELRNPFKNGIHAIWSDGFHLVGSDYTKLKQFCFAKGMKPDWMENNPYISEESTTHD